MTTPAISVIIPNLQPAELGPPGGQHVSPGRRCSLSLQLPMTDDGLHGTTFSQAGPNSLRSTRGAAITTSCATSGRPDDGVPGSSLPTASLVARLMDQTRLVRAETPGLGSARLSSPPEARSRSPLGTVWSIGTAVIPCQGPRSTEWKLGLISGS